MGRHRRANWEVYAFEENPFIQNYVNKFVKSLDGLGLKPELRIPPAASLEHLQQLAPRYGCSSEGEMVKCMLKKFKARLNSLLVNTSLRDNALVHERLMQAASPSINATRYTLIPAGVGVQARTRLTGIESARSALMFAPVAKASVDADLKYSFPVVDVVSWISYFFREADYVVVKMDIDGAESAILESLLRHQGLGLIDVLLLKCRRAKKGTCERLRAAAKVKIKIKTEGDGYIDVDRHSVPELYSPSDPTAASPTFNIPYGADVNFSITNSSLILSMLNGTVLTQSI